MSADIEPKHREGSAFTHQHAVAVDDDAALPADLDPIDVASGHWAVVRASGPYPATVQDDSAASATK